MTTAAYLDQTRTELVERHWDYARLAGEVDPGQQGKLRVWQSPHARTWLLQPINLTPSFVESNEWDSVKFRLSDVEHNADWWTEVPEQHKLGTPFDYYLSCVVKAENVTAPADGYLLDLMGDVDTLPSLPEMEYTQNIGVNSLISNDVQPQNQAYTVSFFQEGRPTSVRSDLFIFYFGDFALRVSSTGQASLYQCSDPTDFTAIYGFCYAFPWAFQSDIQNSFHRIHIIPHARNQIEFMAQNGKSWMREPYVWNAQQRGTNGGGLYKIPGEIVTDEDGNHIITQAGKWGLRFSKEYRAYIQVSKFIYNDGTDNPAGLWDSGKDIGFIPTNPVTVNCDIDENGGSFTSSVTVTGTVAQFYLQLQGAGDITGASGKHASTSSPEFYSYHMRKDPKFQTFTRDSFFRAVKSVSIDQGDKPDSERLTVTLDNSCPDTQLDALKRRAEIPMQLGDLDTSVCHFEGTCYQVTSGEAPGNAPRELRLEVLGMADNLLRMDWIAPTDYGTSLDKPGEGWMWPDAIRDVFESSGFDPTTQVVIEEESSYAFRLWMDGNSGGPTGGSGVSSGHEQATMQGLRWKPNPLTPVYEFAEFLIESVLGWHWFWDRENHLWRIYKRPDPNNATDVSAGKFNPKASFYGQGINCGPVDVGDGLPSYAHRGLMTKTERPVCTTMVGTAYLNEAQVLTKAELQEALTHEQADPHPEDPVIKTEPRWVFCTLVNKLGITGDPSNPDYLGRDRARLAVMNHCGTREALKWMTRRLYADNCFGRVFAEWEAEWGDPYTGYLRKWDLVNLDTGVDGALEMWYIDRIEPQWNHDAMRRARYRASLYRPDIPPPR